MASDSVEEWSDDEDARPVADSRGRATEWHRMGSRYLPGNQPEGVCAELPIGIYALRPSPLGVMFEPRQTQYDATIRLPDSEAAVIIQEIKRFWTLEDDFAEFGYMHKRGILLHGPPGSGKTVIVRQVAEDMVDIGGVVLLAPFRDPQTLIQGLHQAREVEPRRPFLVIIEDLDDLLNFGETEILALLDGEDSIENVVYLATTNFIDSLPARISNRPSRFDKSIFVGPPNSLARKLYLQSRGIAEPLASQMADAAEGLSFAHLKELIISVVIFRNPLDVEVERLRSTQIDEKPARRAAVSLRETYAAFERERKLDK